MDRLSQRFPPGLKYLVNYDTTTFVHDTIHDVLITLLIAFVLVVIVVFVFLGSLRATLIPAIAVPVSVIGTFAVLLAMGYSANTISLLAMVLAIGILVDDAIVVVENVERVMEEEPNLSPADATKKAMTEITGADHRDHVGAAFGVRADRLHPRRFGHIVPAIRGDDQRRDADLGIERADLVAGVVRRVSAALRSKARPDGLGAAAHRQCPRRLCRDRAPSGARLVSRRRRDLGERRRDLSASPCARRPGFCRRKTRAPSSSRCSCRTAPRSPAPATRSSASRPCCKQMPQIQNVFAIIGFSIIDGVNEPNAAFIVPTLKPFADRVGAANSAQALIARVFAEGQQIRTATVIPFNLPPIIGLSTTGGFEYELEGLEGQDPAAMNSVMQGLLAAANQDPRLTRVFSTYHRQQSVDLSRHRPREGAGARPWR